MPWPPCRALKDAPDISKETKRRVSEAAATLGYQPNRAGVRLRTGKTNVVALVFSAEAEMMNHTSRLIYSITAAMRGTAYHMIVFPMAADENPMDPIRYIVETGSADGVIMNQTRPDDPRAHYMAKRDFAFATHGRTDTGIDHPYFDCDNHSFARIATQQLASRGHKRLLLIAPPTDQNYGLHMIEGFRSECQALGLAGDVLATLSSDSNAPTLEAALAARFAQPTPPDAIISGSTNAAVSAIIGAESVGKTIGRDFDLVAKEAFPFLKRFRRDIIAYHEDIDAAGGFLARALIATIEKRAIGTGQFLDQPSAADFA